MPNSDINRKILLNGVKNRRTPTTIGQVFKVVASQLSDLTDFTINTDGATSIVLDGGYIKISGSPAAALFPLDNFIQYNGWLTSFEEWTFKWKYIIKTLVAADEGLIGGWRNDSSISDSRSDWNVHYRRFGSSANGDGYRYFNGTTTLTPNTFNTNPLTAEVTPVINNVYEGKIQRIMTATGAQFILTITDETAITSQSGAIDYTHQNTTGQLDMSSSKFFFGTTGGEHWIGEFEFETTDKKFPNWAIYGDSMSVGYNATSKANHYVGLLRSNFPNLVFTVNACQGDKPSTVVNRNSEVQLIAAKNVINFISSNQLVASGVAATLASYATMVSNQNLAGASLRIHINMPPRAGNATVPTLNAGLLSAYPTDIHIDAYTELNDPGNPGFIKAMYTDDGIHPNDLFWTWLYGQLAPYIPLGNVA